MRRDYCRKDVAGKAPAIHSFRETCAARVGYRLQKRLLQKKMLARRDEAIPGRTEGGDCFASLATTG